MTVRRQRATTSKEIMEKDVNVAICKAKARFRSEKVFYILNYPSYPNIYFASGYPDNNKVTREKEYFQKWIFNETKSRWEESK